jgi:hypothetical protein
VAFAKMDDLWLNMPGQSEASRQKKRLRVKRVPRSVDIAFPSNMTAKDYPLWFFKDNVRPSANNRATVFDSMYNGETDQD